MQKKFVQSDLLRNGQRFYEPNSDQIKINPDVELLHDLNLTLYLTDDGFFVIEFDVIKDNGNATMNPMVMTMDEQISKETLQMVAPMKFGDMFNDAEGFTHHIFSHIISSLGSRARIIISMYDMLPEQQIKVSLAFDDDFDEKNPLHCVYTEVGSLFDTHDLSNDEYLEWARQDGFEQFVCAQESGA